MQKKSAPIKKSKINAAAIAAAVVILLSCFLFELFNFRIFGNLVNNKRGIMFNLILDMFSGNLNLLGDYQFLVLGMIILYIFIFFLYFLNGIGVIKERYAIYASIFSVVYLFLGFILVNLVNRNISLPFFGNHLASATIGLGTYLIPILGIAYLFLKNPVNNAIKI